MQDNSNTTKSRIEIAPQFVYSQPQQMMSDNIDTGNMLKLDGYENLIKVNLLDIIDGVAMLMLMLHAHTFIDVQYAIIIPLLLPTITFKYLP